MRKFYSRILAVCMAGTMALTPFTPVGTLIGNTITIEAKAAEARACLKNILSCSF